jgi:ABC-type transporter Mla maintaining outer membrane lipid asymmetry ATPase subunit MlaF
VALLKGGRIAEQGPAEAMHASQHPDVRAFLDGVRDAPETEAALGGSARA